MIELPETYVLAEQINRTLVGKTIAAAAADTHHHAFAWYTGDPAGYNDKLAGRTVTSANPGTVHSCGGQVEIICEDMLLVISTPIKYHEPGAKLPKSHQLLLTFADGSAMSCTVQMWGAMFCFPVGADDFPYDKGFVRNQAPSPYEAGFDEAYFHSLWDSVKPTMSAKAFLATEQRIPGLGNGVLQDILFGAGIHPKRRMQTMGDAERAVLFHSLKDTMTQMKEQGGRDTERDLFCNPGGYRTILSAKTLSHPCPQCGDTLVRQAFLGGNIYFCPTCQPSL